ncbi:VOC family protein [Citricoccus sp. GCM10030269]|uniref:VOC family protein n=1 Tax=Citricoccus sp. GCM10030269 TaxID=3273388 RepID=UPI00360BD537
MSESSGHPDTAAAPSASATSDAAPTVTPFLMFEGNCREAVEFYVATFGASLPDTAVDSLALYGPDDAGTEGLVAGCEFTIAGQRIRAFDSPAHHEFTFTPSISFFIDVTSADDVRTLASALGEDGFELMPPDDYGFSELFAWVQDRWGVTWQLNYARG